MVGKDSAKLPPQKEEFVLFIVQDIGTWVEILGSKEPNLKKLWDKRAHTDKVPLEFVAARTHALQPRKAPPLPPPDFPWHKSVPAHAPN